MVSQVAGQNWGQVGRNGREREGGEAAEGSHARRLAAQMVLDPNGGGGDPVQARPGRADLVTMVQTVAHDHVNIGFGTYNFQPSCS